VTDTPVITNYANELLHEAGRHDTYMPIGSCRFCDDLRAADYLRALYDMGYYYKLELELERKEVN
jgi:hypothetical protein